MYVRTLETILYVRSNVVRSSYYHNTYFAGIGAPFVCVRISDGRVSR
jgi:hypothetical protein